MRILLFYFLFFCVCSMYAKPKYKYVYHPLNIHLSYQGGSFLQYGKGIVSTKTLYGNGGEITLKNRITSSISFNLGFHLRVHRLDMGAYDNSLKQYFSSPQLYTSINHYNESRPFNMTVYGIAPSVSYIHRFQDFRIEPFFKLNTSFISYSIDSRIYIREKDSINQYQVSNVNGKRTQFMMLPAVGANIVVPASNLLSFTFSIESGYCVGKQVVVHEISTKEDVYSSAISITTPKIYFLGGLGILLRPFDRVNEREREYNDDVFLRKKERNN